MEKGKDRKHCGKREKMLENLVGKGKNASTFFPFPTRFSTNPKTNFNNKNKIKMN